MITTSEVAVLGILATLTAGLIGPLSASRQAKRSRRNAWALRAGDAYSEGRAGWSRVGEVRQAVSVGAAEGVGLVAEGETERRVERAERAIDHLRAVAATSERTADGAVPHEIAQRLWILTASTAATLNAVRSVPREQLQVRLAPLTDQAALATDGEPGVDGLGAKSLEELFEEFEAIIRRAASP